MCIHAFVDDLKANNALNEHTEGIVELLRQINTVEIAFVAKETEQGYTKLYESDWYIMFGTSSHPSFSRCGQSVTVL